MRTLPRSFTKLIKQANHCVRLNSNNLGQYDRLVQGCLSSGAALCILDLHNYARWQGKIVGQGGPTNAQLADVWKQLATKYGSNSKIAFGVMNEPHDIPDIKTWAATVQAVVTAIRGAGAASNMILLPGNGFTSAELRRHFRKSRTLITQSPG